MRRFAIIAKVLLIGGCAHATWVPANPSVDAASFEPTKARCDYIARHGSSGCRSKS
jgi:hypothetical protein